MAHRILTSLVGIDATFSSTLSLTSLAGVGNRMLIVNSAGTVSTQAIPVGTVTSVGLSMPSAFSVASSPVTGSGTLTVTGAGTTAQYIDGTGALQTFPTTLPSTNVQHQVKAGVAINKGQAVYVTSADGTNMIVGLASNTSEATSSKTMGLLDATVAINGFANVITEGLLAGLDTSTAGAAGDPVWLGTNGNLIYGLANKPYAPAHLVFIGIVTRKNLNNGEIFVKVQNGFELKEIHDVDLITTTPINGHLLGFDGTLWVNKTIAGWLGYTPLSGTGTTNYVPKWTGSTALGNSLMYDNGTTLLVGTTTASTDYSSALLALSKSNNLTYQEIRGSSQATLVLTQGVTANSTTPAVEIFNGYNFGIKFIGGTGGAFSNYPLYYYAGDGAGTGDYVMMQAGGSERLRIASNGNVQIGTTTNAGYKLDVNGTGRIQSNFEVGAGGSSLQGVKVIPGSYPSLQFWETVMKFSLDREGNNGLSFSSVNGFCAHMINTGTLIGGTSRYDLNSSAQLQVESTTRGFLQPRMTTTQRNAITTPATGLSIYNTTTNTEDYYNGTAWVSLQTSITNPVTGTGTTNYLPKWTSSSVIGNSLVYDDGTNVGIGTTTFLGKFQVGSGSATQFQVASSGASIYVGPSSGNYNMNITTNTIQSSNSGNTNTYLYIQPNGTGNVAMCSSGTNKVLIGTTTDAGYKLDVNGTTRIVGVATFNNNINQTSGTASFANGILLDSTRRIFGANTITYQSNDAASQHYFKNDISSGLSGTLVTIGNGSGTFGTTSASNFLNISGRLATASGTNNLTSILLNHTVENTGTYTGTIRGIYYNPSSIIGTGFTHRAIETTTGDVLFGTTSGVVGIGTTTLSTEANLYLGAKSTSEGGQLILQKGTAQTYATHLDNYNNLFRVLYGTDTGSSGVAMTVNMSTGQVSLPFYTTTSSFTGTAVGYIAFDSGGNLLTVAAPGGAVTSVSGGTGVTVSPTTGNVVVSIGQSVATSATPSFDQVFTTNNGNGTNLKIGDDAWIGDVNTANTFGIRGQQNAANGYISFGSTDISTGLGRAGSGPLTWGGYTIYHSNNSNTITALGTITTGVWNGTAITDTYISSASTWNAKQNALTLTTTGTSGAATLVGATLNIPQYQSVLTNPVTGTGTTNYISKFTGTSTIGNSLLFDDGTNVGISTTSPSYKLDVNGTFRVQGNSSIIATSSGVSSSANAYIYDSTTNYLVFTKRGSSEIGNMGLPAGSVEIGNYNNGALGIWTSSNYIALGSNSSEKMRLNISTGNLLIGTTTDSGYKFDVNGTGRFQNTLYLATTGTNASPVTALRITSSDNGNGARIEFNDSNVGIMRSSDQLQFREYTGGFNFIRTSNSNILFAISQTATNVYYGTLTTSGSITASTALARGVYFNNTLVAAANNDVLVGLDITPTFTNGAFTGLTNVDLRTKNAGVVVGSNYGYGANYGYTSDGIVQIQAGSTGILGSTFSTQMVFRPSGNAASYNSNYWSYIEQSAGGFLITSARYQNLYLRASTNSAASADLYLQAGSNTIMLLKGATSNVLINTTTDAGYKLDVNGTGRFTPNGSAISAFYIQTHGTYVNRTRFVVGATDGANNNSGLQFTASTGTGKTYINGWDDGGTSQYDIVISSNGGRVQFGTDSSSVASSQVTINSTTRGFLPPRMTATQRTAISTPAVGLIVYQTDSVEGVYVYTSGGWKSLTMV